MSERAAWQVADDAAVLYEQSFVPAVFARAAVQVCDLAGIGAGDRVLDVGCGTGALAREAARRIDPGGRVTGLDLNPRMLAVARRVAPEIDWREGEAGHLPFEAGCFDAVLSQYALMFFPDRPAGLREMWRVLAPGGRLAVAVCGPLAQAGAYAALAAVAEDTCPPAVVEMLRSPFALGDRAKLPELCRAAGIQGADVQTFDCPVRFPSIDALVQTEIDASPIREIIDAHSRDALLEGARRALARFVADGQVAFSMPTHVVRAVKT